VVALLLDDPEQMELKLLTALVVVVVVVAQTQHL
jgi:hypothetical protein